MASRVDPKRWTFESYFSWEQTQEMRHEFIDGEVFAMTGGTLRHGRVQFNLVRELGNKIGSGPCLPFGNDVKLSVAAVNRAFYPDAFVVCDASALEDRGVANDATVIFEVLSPSTAAYDRGEKFAFYRRLPGFRHYVTIDPEALIIEAFRLAGGVWSLVVPLDETLLAIPDIGIELEIAEIFKGVGEAREAVGMRRAVSE